MSRSTRVDRPGRAFWQMVLELFRESGLSVRQFCQQEGLSQASFYAWRKKLSSGAVRAKASLADTDKADPANHQRHGSYSTSSTSSAAAATSTSSISSAATTGFIEVHRPVSRGVIEIVTPDDYRICIEGVTRPQELTELLSAVRRSC